MTDPNSREIESVGEYWSDAFASLSRLLADESSHDANASLLYVRWMASGLLLYTKGGEVQKELLYRIADFCVVGGDATLAKTSTSARNALAEVLEDLSADYPAEKRLEQSCQNAIVNLRKAANTGAASFGGISGSVFAVVKLPGDDSFSVQDLLVSTCAAGQRHPAQTARLEAYANSVRVVDALTSGPLHALTHFTGQNPHGWVTDMLCIPACNHPVGDANTGDGGRSLDLALLVASMAHRFSWRFSNSRIVFTGKIESAGAGKSMFRVSGVAYVREKLKGVAKWAKDTGSAEETICLIPRENLRELTDLESEFKASGLRVVGVDNLNDLVDALPFEPSQTENQKPWFEISIGLMVWIWFAERIFGGEWLPDPPTQSAFPMFSYLVAAVVPALLPATVTVLVLIAAKKLKSPGMTMAQGLVGITLAAHLQLVIQFALGILTLPKYSPFLAQPDGTVRLFNIWKDTGAAYPVLLLIGVCYPLLVRNSAHAARQGLAIGYFGRPGWKSLRWWAEGNKWLPVTMIIAVSVFLAGIVVLFRGDIYYKFPTHHNYILVAHVVFQILWAVAICLYGFMAGKNETA